MLPLPETQDYDTGTIVSTILAILGDCTIDQIRSQFAPVLSQEHMKTMLTNLLAQGSIFAYPNPSYCKGDSPELAWIYSVTPPPEPSLFTEIVSSVKDMLFGRK